jgi:hypothetical protein
MIGVRADGTKELIALDDGHRESTESSLDLLRGCKRRGMAAQVLAVGDGALGFWFAVREVFPETREQRCWWRTIGNVRPTCSRPTTAPSGPRRPPRSPTTSTCCWPSRTTRRALDPAAHHQPDRVHLRHRQASPASHQGPRLPRRRCRDGVHAHRISTDPVVGRQRTPPRRGGPCRRYSRTASSSNHPTNQRVVISKSRDTPIRSPVASLPAAVARAVSGIRVSAAADKGHDRHLTRPASFLPA